MKKNNSPEQKAPSRRDKHRAEVAERKVSQEIYPSIGSLPFDRRIFEMVLENRFGIPMSEILKVEGAKQAVEDLWQEQIKSENAVPQSSSSVPPQKG